MKKMQRNVHGKTPYDVIKCRHITEKSTTLWELQEREGNPSLKACKSPKVVFLVDKKANKCEIADAVEKIYSEKNVEVKKVNIVNVKPKKRRMRRFVGAKPSFKKAIVTLAPGDNIEEGV